MVAREGEWMLAWEEQNREITKGHEETFGVMDMLVMMIVVMVLQL